MADQHDLHPEAATLDRSNVVRGLIHRTFAVTFKHLSQLEGRTIDQFFRDRNHPYKHKFFQHSEKKDIESNVPVEKYSAHLLHKLLKHCCGLKPHDAKAWKSEDEADTLEFLITYCWTEYGSLCQASEMTNSTLNHHMDKVLEALVLIIEKVEKHKEVDESDLKSELTKHVGEKINLYNNHPVSNHIYSILSQHLVHIMLVIVYQQLNNLKGMELGKFLTTRRINLTSRTLYSNERKFLEQSPTPQSMSINVLYKVIKRVCFGFTPYKKCEQSSVLEATLSKLQKEYSTPPASDEAYTEKSYNIYKIFLTALKEVTKQTGKKPHDIIQKLPTEPYIKESFRKPIELPNCSMHHVSVSTEPNSYSPEGPSNVPSPPGPSIAMATASTKASLPQNLTQEEVNVAVLFKVLCPGGVTVQTLALVFNALKGSIQNTTTKEKRRKYKFTKQEIETIADTQNCMSTDNLHNIDVTLMCKLLRSGCPSLSDNDDDWIRSGDTLEHNITLIKDERNNMSHDVSTIKTEELTKTLENIKIYLKTILEMTEQKLGEEEKDMKKALEKQENKVISEINEIMTSFPSSSYYWTMECMKKDMVGKIKLEARVELQKTNMYRENLLYMSPLGGSDNNQQYLTTRAVYVDRELEDMSHTKAEGSYQIKNILFCKDNIFANSKVIVIHGRPGEGKTSLCKHAYHLWSENLTESSKEGVDLLIYIPCRFVTTKSVSAYLKERLPNTFKNIEKDDIIPLMQEPKVVFVVDGYDEAGSEAKCLIDDILTLLPDSRVIITTKTQWAQKIILKVKAVTSCYKILRMMEVTEDMRQQVIRNIFKAVGREENCGKFLGYLSQVKEKIQALICRPLTFCLLSLLWIDKPEKAKQIQTSAQLYHTLTDLILDRVCKKLNKDHFYCHKWMITLGEIAWKNLKNNQHHLNNQDLNTLKERAFSLKFDVEDYNCILSSLIQCSEVHSSLESCAKSWNFMINNQQEYFAAEYIVDCIKNENSSLSKFLELGEKTDKKYRQKLQRLVPLIEFVCGLLEIYEELTEPKIKELTEIMSIAEPWAFTAVTTIFQPLLKKSTNKSAVKTLFADQEMSTFENYDPQSILWVLKHTSLTLSSQVTFINTVSDLPHIDPLLEFLLESKANSVTVKVDVNKEGNISSLANLTRDKRYKNIVFTFMSWKPLCMTKLVKDWPWFSPLRLFLHPEVFHLLWLELLICLLSLNHKKTRIVYSLSDPRFGEVVKEMANWLSAEIATDSSLAPTELLIDCV